MTVRSVEAMWIVLKPMARCRASGETGRGGSHLDPVCRKSACRLVTAGVQSPGSDVVMAQGPR